MEFISAMSEVSEASEVSEVKGESSQGLSPELSDKFDKLMGDDKIPAEEKASPEQLTPEERESKFNKLFDDGDFFKKSVHNENERNVEPEIQRELPENDETTESVDDISQKREPNSEYELNGNTYETDDNGDTYKKNGELLPNTEYTINGNKYKTDENGNKISCDSEPVYTENGTRNNTEQTESGGEDRHDNDDGGHIIARILGGAEGEENLVPMRSTINRGDYKKMEYEIAKALQGGKKVTIHIDLEYDGDSERPSKIRAEYTIDGEKTVVEFDNKENSTELLDSLQDKIGDEDYNNLKEEIADMKADGVDASITSVKVEYDENGNPVKVTVGVLDESAGKKTYKVYEPKQEV